jgi:hypothetical protein
MTTHSGRIQIGQKKRLFYLFLFLLFLFRVIIIPNGQALALAFARP